MKSDLTCPVEVVRVHVRREEKEIVEEPRKQLVEGEVVIEEGEPRKRIEEQIICDIEFQNLSEKETASIQMNIICFDADNQRLGPTTRHHAYSGNAIRPIIRSSVMVGYKAAPI